MLDDLLFKESFDHEEVSLLSHHLDHSTAERVNLIRFQVILSIYRIDKCNLFDTRLQGALKMDGYTIFWLDLAFNQKLTDA